MAFKKSVSFAYLSFLFATSGYSFTDPHHSPQKFPIKVEKKVLYPKTEEAPQTERFAHEFNSDVQIKYDKKSKAVRLVSGELKLVLSSNDSQENHVAQIYRFIDEHHSIFGIDKKDVELFPSAVHLGKNEQFFKFKIKRDGLLIQDAHLNFRFKNFKLVQVAALTFSEAQERTTKGNFTQPEPELSNSEYKDIQFEKYQYRAVETVSGYELVKVKTYRVTTADDRQFILQIDMATHKLFEVSDTRYYLTGQIEGDLYPRWYDENILSTGFPFLSVQDGNQNVVTDKDGSFETDSTTPPTLNNLSGPFVRIRDMLRNPVKGEAQKKENGNWGLALKRTHTGDTWADDQLAQHMAFYHVNAIVQYAKKYISTPWFNSPLLANTNHNRSCNAYWDGSTINFFRSGGGCANTALISDVIYHEWGHGLDQKTGGIQDGAFSEGFGDILSMIMTRSHILGIGFKVSDRSPVRDLEPDKVYPRDRGEVHSEGLIIGSTFWDLFKALREQTENEDEAIHIISNYAFKMIFTADTYLDVYDAILVIDDNDDNLLNGTPNKCLINSVFAQHGLAETDVTCSLASVNHLKIEDSNNNSVFDPGEEIKLTPSAFNPTPNTLPNLTATLKINDPFITVTQKDLSWNAIPSQESAQSLSPASFAISPEIPCGHEFTTHFDMAGNNRKLRLSFTHHIGKEEGVLESLSPTDLPLPIYDYQTTIAVIDASSNQWAEHTKIKTARLRFDIEHTYVGDLTIHLVSPENEVFDIFRGRGTGGRAVHFDEDISEKLKGKKGKGIWSLKISDSGSRDEGTLEQLQLDLTPSLFFCEK